MKKMIFLVGLSHKYGTNWEMLPAFCPSSNSGKIITMIEERLQGQKILKYNLYPWVPLDDTKKLRYPNKQEKAEWWKILLKIIKEKQPTHIILFGKEVSNFIKKQEFTNKGKIIETKHPSYIRSYKRKEIKDYLDNLLKEISC